jgi:hypothetical protein
VRGSYYEELALAFQKFPKYHLKITIRDRNVKVSRKTFPHCNIHKYIWTSPDWKTHKQIYHVFTGRQRHSSLADVRSFSAANCDSGHYLMEAKVRERSAANKEKDFIAFIWKGSVSGS